MKKIHSLFALVLLSVSAVAQGLPQDPAVRKGKLKNGMTYYIRHNGKEAGLADFYIAQRVGSILEEPRQRGLAHFLAWLSTAPRIFLARGKNWVSCPGAKPSA